MLILLGGLLVLAGIIVVFVDKAGLPLGRLPGDITYRGRRTTVYFPIVTSILLSVVLSVILYVIGRMKR